MITPTLLRPTVADLPASTWVGTDARHARAELETLLRAIGASNLLAPLALNYSFFDRGTGPGALFLGLAPGTGAAATGHLLKIVDLTPPASVHTAGAPVVLSHYLVQVAAVLENLRRFLVGGTYPPPSPAVHQRP